MEGSSTTAASDSQASTVRKKIGAARLNVEQPRAPEGFRYYLTWDMEG